MSAKKQLKRKGDRRKFRERWDFQALKILLLPETPRQMGAYKCLEFLGIAKTASNISALCRALNRAGYKENVFLLPAVDLDTWNYNAYNKYVACIHASIAESLHNKAKKIPGIYSKE